MYDDVCFHNFKFGYTQSFSALYVIKLIIIIYPTFKLAQAHDVTAVRFGEPVAPDTVLNIPQGTRSRLNIIRPSA